MNAFLIINTQVFPLSNTPITIGRRLDNHLVFSDPMVSRSHAQIDRQGDQFVIIDLDSSGGTYINGKRISRAVLKTGDSIVLAHIPIVFVENAPHLADQATEDTGSLRKNIPTMEDTEPTVVDAADDWRGEA